MVPHNALYVPQVSYLFGIFRPILVDLDSGPITIIQQKEILQAIPV